MNFHVLAATFVIAVTEPADASEVNAPVVVEPITWSADSPDRLRESFTQQLDAALRERAAVAHAPPDCVDDICLAQLAAREGARGRLRFEIDERERDYEIGVNWRTADGNKRATLVRCDVCTPVEAANAAARAAVDLLGARVLASLSVVSSPPGADVTIDGRRRGRTPYATEIEPGPHRVEVSKAQHLTELRTVDLSNGSAEDIRVELEIDRRPRERAMRIAGGTTMGVGVATLVTGIVLAAVDEAPVKSNCDGVHRDRFGNCEFRWNTLAGGVTAIVLGAGMTAAGAVLYAKNRPRVRTELRASLTRVDLTLRF